ncbi:DUF4359 domain-containing protein [Ectobacillus ponti]|uniref:DUF4359 domain-containing protein n=1 Tax=Ectobacillus ponti TaxID=2961894 RepID=A0AA41X6H9_9BACI|nr:DUF4359 domain-containing protein [Ectobacillus ponti]MCP8967715.1 DUF4359 domain-containing protein [Ectobacillus ponti]
MKWKYVWLALLIGILVYLAKTNPDKAEYNAWASKQFVQRTEVHEAMARTEAESPDSLWGELASLGKKLTEKYVQPQVGLIIDEHTSKKDYIFFSLYNTSMQLGSDKYEYITLGAAEHFWLLQAPEDTKKESRQ